MRIAFGKADARSSHSSNVMTSFECDDILSRNSHIELPSAMRVPGSSHSSNVMTFCENAHTLGVGKYIFIIT